MNDRIKEKLKTQIAISQIKNEEKNNMNKNEKFVFKNIGIAACVIISLTGVAFAGSKVVESIWKTPATYEFSYELSEEEKNNAITEEEAKNKASEYLRKIGLDEEITGLQLEKSEFEHEAFWDIGFESGTMIIDGKGNFKSLNIPSYNYTIPNNYGITREEARKVARELLSKYNPHNNNDEYELVSLKRNAEEDENAYIWYAEFYKKYGDLLNPHERINIGWIPTITGLYSLNIENIEYEKNEQVISKEDAIKIATEKDKTIETRYNITSVEAEIGIDKMNTDVVYRAENLENYEIEMLRNFEKQEDGTYQVKENAVFYKVEDRVRKVWEVTIYYDHYEFDYPERYVYFVDTTTGEIIGGDKYYGNTMNIKNLIADPYNLIEK